MLTEIYKDANAPVEERVEDLLARMTIAEKIGQLNQVHAALDKSKEIRDLAKEGLVGSRILASTAFAGKEDQSVSDVAESNEVQRIAVEESRLGIPIINGRDIIHGHRTVFPIPLAQAASWDTGIVEKASSIAALEASAYAVHWTFAPMMDIARDARWGRIIEGYGEDPYLCGEMAKASVKGFQGEDMSEDGRIAACAKHFIAYGGAEGGRDYNVAECTDNTLRNVYLPPFKAAVEAGVSTVMSGFHEIGGEPVSGSHYLLTEILSRELGFNGYVISDWGSVYQLIHHGVAEDKKAAANIAFNAGVDMDMCDNCFIDHIRELIEEGKVSEERLNDAVRRILRVKFKLGLFEKPYTDISLAKKVYLKPEHIACTREAAAKSMVLLKNDNEILPLPKKDRRIAVIGPMAESKRQLLGSWTLDGKGEETVSVAEGIKCVAPEAQISVNSGTTDEMIHAARRADVVVLVLGESHLNNGESSNVTSLELPAGQNEIIEAVSQFNKPIITVICAGRPLAIAKVAALSDAVLYAWHPGTQGGMAVADILFGDVNPSAKLPVTFPYTTGQVPIYYNHKRNGHNIDEYYDESRRYHYMDAPGKPLYPFGFGLSYSSFKYDELTIDKKTITPDDSVSVSVRITNTGSRAGTEIVQCYISDKVASTTRPFRELKSYQRVELRPGEAKVVSFRLGRKELSFYGRDGKLCLEPGAFGVFVGKSCIEGLESEFNIV